MGINKLALKNFYENHKAAYESARLSGDTNLWDEDYKWQIFPELNRQMSEFTEITKETLPTVIQLLQKANPSQGSFAHWIDMDDLKLLSEHPNGFHVVRDVWHRPAETIGASIDSANDLASFLIHKKFSPSTFGYILAAQDANAFAIYRDTLVRDIAELNAVPKPGSLTQGQKYQLLNDSYHYIASLMQADGQFNTSGQFNAIEGQDFMYVTIQYPKERLTS